MVADFLVKGKLNWKQILHILLASETVLILHNWWIFMDFVKRKIPHIVMFHLLLHSMHWCPALLCDSEIFFYCHEIVSLRDKHRIIIFSNGLIKMKEKNAEFSNNRISMCLSNDLNDHVMKEFIPTQWKFHSFKDERWPL